MYRFIFRLKSMEKLKLLKPLNFSSHIYLARGLNTARDNPEIRSPSKHLLS